MNRLRILFGLFLTLLLCCPVLAAEKGFSGRIVDLDPSSGSTLAAYEKLYLRVAYQSEVPVRFQVTAERAGERLEFGVMQSDTVLRPAGQEEALVWVSFPNATRIDRVQVRVLDAEWSEIDRFGTALDVHWTNEIAETERETVDWVQRLIRKSRLRQEMVFDPAPQKKESVYDFFFFLSVFSIPFYLYLQVRFLRRWRGRWREMAAIPIISIAPVLIMTFLGSGMELRLWVIFIFRGLPLALIYLLALWMVKRYSGKRRATKVD